MTPRQLEQAGKILFGEGWRTAFCTIFGITGKSLRRMLSGDIPVPAGLASDVVCDLRDHGRRLDALLESLNDV